MRQRFAQSLSLTLAAASLTLAVAMALSAPALAQQPAPDTASDAKPARVLTPEEVAEKEGRKACKIEICATFRNRISEGGDIACDIVKTWREEDIEDMVSGGTFDWPWGRALCTAKLRLPRTELVKAVTEPKYVLGLATHTVDCELDRKSEGKVYKVGIAMAPEVTFENGKAVAAQANWGALEAPTLAYGVIWPATGVDNSTNVLGGQLVKMVNEFLTTKCDEVKDALPAKAN